MENSAIDSNTVLYSFRSNLSLAFSGLLGKSASVSDDQQESDSSSKLLDVYDFDNVNQFNKTYSGSTRNIIDVLQKDLDKNRYAEQGTQELDPELLNSPNFESYKYTRNQLIEFIISKPLLEVVNQITWSFSLIYSYVEIFEKLNIDEIPTDILRKFLEKCQSIYNRVPYHNFTHAFSLVHFAYWLITNIDSEKCFIKDDIIAILIACIGHDLNHPGMNNTYLVNTKDSVAMIYNDKSVLENMHSSLLFTVLDQEEYNVLANLSAERSKYIRKVVIEAILCTDMTQHFKMCKQFEGFDKAIDKEDETTRSFLVSMIVHAWDISNLMYEFDHYIRWAFRVQQEFSDQYETEIKLGTEKYGKPSEIMKYTDELGFYKSQLGFINFIVKPMWKQLHNFFDFDKVIMDNLDANAEKLEEKIKNLQ